jgi:energy-converting hydrogenase B subunit Q
MTHAILTTVADRPGMLSSLTKVLADHDANITYVDIHSGTPTLGIYFEVALPDGADVAAVLADLHQVAGVERAEETPSFSRIYGKRIVVMGGGAQVGLVAMGAISEADRHNIRGERISIDTIPLVGEQELAAAVRAVVRLPRVQMLVLAGSIMGGDITEAVRTCRRRACGDLAQPGGQRARRRRPRGERSDPGWRHGCDGRGRHGEIRFDAAVEAAILRARTKASRDTRFRKGGSSDQPEAD